jgi:hypothetical protein
MYWDFPRIFKFILQKEKSWNKSTDSWTQGTVVGPRVLWTRCIPLHDNLILAINFFVQRWGKKHRGSSGIVGREGWRRERATKRFEGCTQ